MINKNQATYLIVSLIFTCLVYLQVHEFDFVTFDDAGYYANDIAIHQLDGSTVKTIFTRFYKGNYHPLTTLTYAIEWQLFGDRAAPLHLLNLLLHLANVLIVFVFVRQLGLSAMVAGFASLVFGIHPMHAESVAWISERKDVLYTFFFLLAGTQLMGINWREKVFLQTKYWLAFLFFILSLLSKSAAVVFPVAMAACLVYREQIPKLRQIIFPLLPFFLLSIGFGLAAIGSQSASGAIQEMDSYTLFDRIFLASWAGLVYVVKFFAPHDMVCFYPYPAKVDGMMSWFVYAAFPVVVLMKSWMWIQFRKGNRDWLFGGVFFAITILLVIQLLPVGGAIMADRYTYLPYLGIAIPIGIYLEKLQMKKGWKNPVRMAMVAWFVFVAIMGYRQVGVWRNSETLWGNAIQHEPTSIAYNNRGYFFNQKGRHEEAIADLQACLVLNVNYQNAYTNLGVAYFKTGQLEEALKSLSEAIRLNQEDEEAYLSRGNVLSSLNRHAEAVSDYDYYLSVDPANAEAWFWRATAKSKSDRRKDALSDYTRAMELRQDYFDPVFWRGVCYFDLGMHQEAIADYTLAMQFRPNDGVIYYNRSLAHYALKSLDSALQDALRAQQLGYAVHPDYFKLLPVPSGQ